MARLAFEAPRLSTSNEDEVGRAHAVPPAHLADYELRVTAYQIGPLRSSFVVEVAQVPQQKDQAVVLRDVVAPRRAVGRLKVPHVTNELLVSDDEGCLHRSLLGELISRTSAVEEAQDSRRAARCGRRNRGA